MSEQQRRYESLRAGGKLPLVKRHGQEINGGRVEIVEELTFEEFVVWEAQPENNLLLNLRAAGLPLPGDLAAKLSQARAGDPLAGLEDLTRGSHPR